MKFRVVVSTTQLTEWYEKELGWRVFCGASVIAALIKGGADNNEELMHRIILPTDPSWDLVVGEWAESDHTEVVEIDAETWAYEILHC